MTGLLIFGAIVLIGAIAIVVFSLRRNTAGEEDDPLQERLAEFIQRGDVTSLEEIELSQPFTERVIIPLIRRVGEFSARFTPQKAIQDTARKLELAGNPWPIDAATFLAIRFILAVVLAGFLIARRLGNVGTVAKGSVVVGLARALWKNWRDRRPSA